MQVIYTRFINTAKVVPLPYPTQPTQTLIILLQTMIIVPASLTVSRTPPRPAILLGMLIVCTCLVGVAAEDMFLFILLLL